MKKSTIIIILIILAISIFARFSFLELDPYPFNEYGTNWFDEESWIHNARNKVLFGTWGLEKDLWNPMFISPIFTYLVFISFKNLGVSTVSMRLVPAFLGLISILIASLLIYTKKKEEGIIFLILSLTNIMLIAYSRVAMLEAIGLFFIIIILSLIIFNSPFTWILTGFLIPFLFFSRLITFFFIASIPISLFAYFLIYKSRKTTRKLILLLIGTIFSSLLWLFWLIPNFKNWMIMNVAGYTSRASFDLQKIAGILLKTLKFIEINPILVIPLLLSIILIFISLRKKEIIPYIDFFLLTSLFLFLLQILILDYHMRRFVFIIPIIILISTRFLSKLSNISLNYKTKTYTFRKTTIVSLFILIYIIITLAQIGNYYSTLRSFPEESRTVLLNSLEIGKIIPDGEKVFGHYANALSMENRIQPYFLDSSNLANRENILSLLNEERINYAILINPFEEKSDLQKREIYLLAPEIFEYIYNNFEVIAEVDGKHPGTGTLRKVFILKRKLSY